MDENKRFSKYANKKRKTMGLFSCFGLRTKSYNAKKYELSEDKKKDKKKRISTDSIGVADTNVYPQLIEETGGGIHPIHSNNKLNENIDSNENISDLSDKHNNEINGKDCCEDKKPKFERELKEDGICIDYQKSDTNNEICLERNIDSEQQKHCTPDHKTVDHQNDHQNHYVSDHNTSYSGLHSHSTDHNTFSMSTTTSHSSAVDHSSSGDGGHSSGGGDCHGGGDSGDCGGGGGDSGGCD